MTIEKTVLPSWQRTPVGYIQQDYYSLLNDGTVMNIYTGLPPIPHRYTVALFRVKLKPNFKHKNEKHGN